ncbi:superfamily II RNA helicase [Arthrobacter crystallopoietes BAB-32]|uniref:Superfamily II RNA helicase n=1 Tax=Arthrobacter crystallopoietes BAB-32 TaxID=1246476 RepID=N1UYX4_9MICC|nr:DEAD/DEAH box helicase [Arthrobacter crystallopoietes]EMY35601.1 superfamily II RNA helicase [Arthrobacter crystallopoietes BAB-32]
MSSPSERYREAKARTEHRKTRLYAFSQTLGFEMDPFQREACEALERGRGVLVAAPTGAGKTVVGEFAIYLAFQRGLKAFYTTPIKALSNQKYTELVQVYGPDRVGLLTGDVSVNPHADVVVMTTEVLRNMLYANSDTLLELGYVVMDEVHYLADRFRGAVWEEVIIHLPSEVRLVSLSATVSNAEEFGAWLDTVRGDTDVVVSEHRPVPLWQHVMVGPDILDLFASDIAFDEAVPALSSGTGAGSRYEVNPELLELAYSEQKLNRASNWGRPAGRRGKRPPSRPQQPVSRIRRASRPEVIARLDKEGLLPAITFIFSRNGCDAAVRQCLDAGLWLTTEREREIIARRVDEAAREIPEEDLAVLGFWLWREGLIRGIAAHHAGMLPTFKEVVEKLFADGLVRAVFATETLALGVNMPARTVVLEKLDKFNGESHVNITAGEYTQLTGRAGRRGIDVEGHAVVLWQPGTDPAAVAGLASRRTYPLNSSFRPTYNMSVNLIAQFGRIRAREILETSFAQFQADRSVVGLAKQVRSREESLAGYAKAMTCHLGDFTEYARLRRELKDAENQSAKSRSRHLRSAAVASLERLRRGDIIDVPGGRNEGYAVILAVDPSGHEPRPTVLTIDKQIRRISAQDLDGPVEVLSTIRVPKSFNGRSPKERRDLASSVRNALHENRPPRRGSGRQEFEAPGTEGQERRIVELRRKLKSHPCHGCSDREDHARWSERWWKLRKETDQLMGQIQGRTNTIAKTFDRVCDLLDTYGYLQAHPDGRVTISESGNRLRRIYGDRDLLVALCLQAGAFDDLDAAEVAAFVSSLVFQAKREETGIRPKMPSVSLETAVDIAVREWSVLNDREEQHKLPLSGEPELGLVWPMYKWAQGRSLLTALQGTELAAGDFVRWAKQVIDLLDQLVKVPDMDPHLVALCRQAITLVRRGVVAYSVVSE